MVRRIPNLLTSIRLGLIPLMVLLLISPSKLMVYLALIVFVIAALTDYADGMIARKYGVVSDLGKLLDPLADKILVMAALVMLTSLRSDSFGEPWVPGWLVVLVLAREFWITGIRAVAANKGTVLAADKTGKWKSTLQMVSIVFLFLHDLTVRIPFHTLRVTAEQLGVNLLIVSVALSYWGAINYTYDIFFEPPKDEQSA